MMEEEHEEEQDGEKEREAGVNDNDNDDDEDDDDDDDVSDVTTSPKTVPVSYLFLFFLRIIPSLATCLLKLNRHCL